MYLIILEPRIYLCYGKVGQDATENAFSRICFVLRYQSYKRKYGNVCTYFGQFYMFPRGLILYFLLHTLVGSDFRDDCK